MRKIPLGSGLTGPSLSRFGRSVDGGVAIQFSLMIVPLFLSVGIATDYVRAASERGKIQHALDSTALAMAKQVALDKNFNVETEAPKYFAGVFGARHGGTSVKIVASKVGETVNVSGSGVVDYLFLGVTGNKTAEISGASSSQIVEKALEISLVLDNTGSMANDGRMTELKSAVLQFIATAEQQAYKGANIKMAIVPYHTKVKIGTAYQNQPWLTFDEVIPNEEVFARPSWAGCVTDRGEMGGVRYDTIAQLPDPGVPASLHPAVQCSFSYPGYADTFGAAITQVLPLTDDWSALRATVNSMTPDGNTNITLGAQWGLNMLLPGAPLANNPAKEGAKNVEKYIVLMTDGENTWNRPMEMTAQIDDRTRAQCTTIKDRLASGRKVIERLFTVLMIEGNEALLRECASTPADFYRVQDAQQIGAVFKAIMSKIAGLRITG